MHTRNDGDRYWEQTHDGRRETRHLPLPDTDDLPKPPTAMTAFEVTNGLRMGELDIDAELHKQMDGWLRDDDPSVYDPTATYLRASNRFNHSSNINLKIAPEVEAAMDDLIERLPMIKNRSEFVRDAIIHNLWRYMGMVGELDRDWAKRVHKTTLRCVQDRMEMEREEWREMLDKARHVMEGLLADRDRVALGEAIDFHAAIAERAPEPWSSRFEELVVEFERRAKAI